MWGNRTEHNDNGMKVARRGGNMARVLIVDDSPTETYKMSSILSKLQLSTRSEAAAYAVEHHIQNHLQVE